MDIKCLRYFIGIADAGSVLRASERLRVAQPALSVSLSNLEAELGIKLMKRTHKGVQLTPDGLVLYQKAKDLLVQYQETVNCLKDRIGRPSGRVSVGMPSTTSALIAADLYRRIRDEYPEIQLYVTDAGAASIYEWLIDRRLDFAILFSLPDDGELDTVPLHSEKFCLVTRAGLAEGDETIEFSSIFSRPLVVSSQTTAWRKVLDDVAERSGHKIASVIETESINVIMSIVMSGEASCVLPLSYVRCEVERGRLTTQRLVNPELCGMMSIANIAGMEMTPAQLAVRDVIVDIVRNSSKLNSPHELGSKTVPALKAFPTRVMPVSAPKLARRPKRNAF